MSVFENKHGEMFSFLSHDGWNGHYSKGVSAKVKALAERVWNEYRLEYKKYDLVPCSNGDIAFESKCVHGDLDIVVKEDRYEVYLYDPKTEKEFINQMVVWA